MTQSARTAAWIVFVAAAVTIALQLHLSYAKYGTVGATLWRLGWFFTILTNALICVSFGLMAIRGRSLSAPWLASLSGWIIVVAVVYHTLLASQADPQGLAWWTNFGFHTGIPMATLAYWALFAPKTPLPWVSAVYGLGWPLIYVIYALVRGMFTAEYPYFFLDLTVLTTGQTMVNILSLSLGFWLIGIVIIGIARLLNR